MKLFNFNNQSIKSIIYLISGVAIISIGFFVGFQMSKPNSQDIKNEQEELVVEVPRRPYTFLSFQSTDEELEAELVEYNKLDEVQGSFKLSFDGFEIFNQVGVINTDGNISGLDPNTPMRIEELDSNTSIILENKGYRLIQTSNTQPFYGVYEYYLVNEASREAIGESVSYEVETDILTNPNIDTNLYQERNVITFKARKVDDETRNEMIQSAIEDFLTLKRENTFIIPTQPETLSPYGDIEYIITQEFSEDHQAIDLKYNINSKDRSFLYELIGEAPLFAVCNGVADGTLSDTQALVITLTCENGEVIEYWHNSANLIYPNQPVLKGDLIGFEGDTGNSDGAHLHLVWKIDGERRDPKELLNTLKLPVTPIAT